MVSPALTSIKVNWAIVGSCLPLPALPADPICCRESYIVPGQSIQGRNNCGAFRFRLWLFRQETEIMVDDRLPTDDGTPVYAKPVDGEFWVCLLEKAFAKLYRCYQALEGGIHNEALTTLTGGVCEQIDFHGQNRGLTLESLMHILDTCFRVRSVAGASVEDGGAGSEYVERFGLVIEHAYTVTGLRTIQYRSERVHLIRIWNPWGIGKAEWRGAWSDWDPRWTPELAAEVQLAKDDDGESWMDLRDFMKYFSDASIVHFPRPMPMSNEVTSLFVYGEWTRNQDPNQILQNNQYVLNISNSMVDPFYGMAVVILSLQEPEQRHIPLSKQQYIDKSMYVYQDGNWTAPMYRFENPYSGCKVYVQRTLLPPGTYRILPWHETPLLDDRLRYLLRAIVEVPT